MMRRIQCATIQPTVRAACAVPLLFALFSATARAQTTDYNGVNVVRFNYLNAGDATRAEWQLYTEDPWSATSHISSLPWVEETTGDTESMNDKYFSLFMAATSAGLPLNLTETGTRVTGATLTSDR